MYKDEYEMVIFYEMCLKELSIKESLSKQEFKKYQEIKAKITNLHWKKLNGVFVRSKCTKKIVDEKTSMYHMIKSEKRRKANDIKAIRAEDDQVIVSQEHVLNYVYEEFKRDFCEPESIEGEKVDSFLRGMSGVITREHNEEMEKVFSSEELLESLPS